MSSTQFFEQFNAGSIDAYLKRLNLLTVEEVKEDFILACRYNRLTLVQELLQIDGDRRIDDRHSEDGFHVACESDSLEVAKFLLGVEDDRRITDLEVIQEEAYEAQYEDRPRILELILSLDDERRLSDQCIEELTPDTEDENEYFSFYVEDGSGTSTFVTMRNDLNRVPDDSIPPVHRKC